MADSGKETGKVNLPVFHLCEAIGDSPEWMRIRKYSEEGKKAELILQLGAKRKSYWFPVTPSVYRKFSYRIRESRLSGLRYLQNYIRRYRGYSGVWPNEQYVQRNRLRTRSLAEDTYQRVFTLFQENNAINRIANITNLPDRVIQKMLTVMGIQYK